MWTIEEHELFKKISRHNSARDYAKALYLADQLLTMVEADPVKRAYTLGCRKAVILRHLGREDEAVAAFEQAYRLAEESDQPALMAYILGDQASIYKGQLAVDIISRAIQLCQEATFTPDPERYLPADETYLRACKARLLNRNGQRSAARLLIKEARRELRRYAYGKYPRYKDAYLIVLGYEFVMRRSLQLLCVIAAETVRQGKTSDLLSRIRQR